MISKVVSNHMKLSKESLFNLVRKVGLKVKFESKDLEVVYKKINELVDCGYDFEEAEASLVVLLLNELVGKAYLFEPLSIRLHDSKSEETGEVVSETTVKVKVNGAVKYAVASAFGPVKSTYDALVKALGDSYPSLQSIRMIDFSVEALCDHFRVKVRLTDGIDSWTTVAVSRSIVEASWNTINDGFKYELVKNQRRLKEQAKRQLEENQVEVLSMVY